jgi:hypothetical protein
MPSQHHRYLLPLLLLLLLWLVSCHAPAAAATELAGQQAAPAVFAQAVWQQQAMHRHLQECPAAA